MEDTSTGRAGKLRSLTQMLACEQSFQARIALRSRAQATHLRRSLLPGSCGCILVKDISVPDRESSHQYVPGLSP